MRKFLAIVLSLILVLCSVSSSFAISLSGDTDLVTNTNLPKRSLKSMALGSSNSKLSYTITVNNCYPGSTVTASYNGYSSSAISDSNGIATIIVDRVGDYTISAPYRYMYGLAYIRDYQISTSVTVLKVPQSYREVEYIESTGTQYINTGLSYNLVSDSLDIILKIIKSNSSSVALLGTAKDIDNTTYYYPCIISRPDSTSYYYGKNSIGINGSSLSVGTLYNVIASSSNGISEFFINGVSQGEVSFSSDITFSSDLILFGWDFRESISNFSSIKLFEASFIINNSVSRYFIPCYNLSSNVIGLYDSVNDVFYTNQGTGTFLKGSDVIYNSNPGEPSDEPIVPDEPEGNGIFTGYGNQFLTLIFDFAKRCFDITIPGTTITFTQLSLSIIITIALLGIIKFFLGTASITINGEHSSPDRTERKEDNNTNNNSNSGTSIVPYRGR